MQHTLRTENGQRWLLGVASAVMVILAVLALTVTILRSNTPADASVTEEPVQIKPIAGTELSQVILTNRAAERLGIKTTATSTGQIEGKDFIVVPYSAIVYDTAGDTWVYTNPEPLVFVRQSITVERIEGDRAFLATGPKLDALVATVGVPELFGAEFGVGH